MKLAKIKDGYLFKTDNPNGTHTYAVYYDRGKREYRAIPTTHLYREDPNRMKEKKAGALMQVKFPSVFLPSGVKDYYHTTDVNGNKINVKSKNVQFISNKHIPKKLSDRVKRHAKGRYSRSAFRRKK